MKPTFRGKVSIAIILALAFSATLFVDLVIFTALIIAMFVLLSGAVWMGITTTSAGRFFACSKTLPRPNERYVVSLSTYPGQEIGEDFYFIKRGRGEVTISSKIEFLRFSPNRIPGREGVTKVHAQFKTPYSGEYSAEELRVDVKDPIGLFSESCSIPVSFEFTVYPKLLDIALTTMKILGRGGIGDTPTNYAGIGTEPYEMRNYQIGDDIRQVNWKATARTGELMVTEHTREVGASYYLVLEAIASNYFDRDSLATTFLQIANSLTLLGGRFGIVVHDGDQVTSIKRLDEYSNSLEFALNAALDFTDLQSAKLPNKLEMLPSQVMKTNRDALSMLGLSLLSKLEESARVKMRDSVKARPFKTLTDLVGENSDEPPAVFYVSGLFDSIESVLETGSYLKRVYGSDFIVINPISPWVVAANEEEGVALYDRHSRNLEILRKSQIEYHVGEPTKIVQELLSG